MTIQPSAGRQNRANSFADCNTIPHANTVYAMLVPSQGHSAHSRGRDEGIDHTLLMAAPVAVPAANKKPRHGTGATMEAAGVSQTTP